MALSKRFTAGDSAGCYDSFQHLSRSGCWAFAAAGLFREKDFSGGMHLRDADGGDFMAAVSLGIPDSSLCFGLGDRGRPAELGGWNDGSSGF